MVPDQFEEQMLVGVEAVNEQQVTRLQSHMKAVSADELKLNASGLRSLLHGVEN